MAVKQRSWRGSNRALFLFSLLLVPMYSFSADSGGAAPAAASAGGTGKSGAPKGVRPKFGSPKFGPPKRGASKGVVPKFGAPKAVEKVAGTTAAGASAGYSPGKAEELPLFHGATIAEMESVYQDAPDFVKKVVLYLKNPRRWPGIIPCRYMFLDGMPGVGKTTLAKAVAYKANWELKTLTHQGVYRKERNGTAAELMARLKAIVAEDKETVVFWDELNLALEHYNSEHHDTDATSEALWSFFDSQEHNDKLFFIGAMNRVDKLPPQIKDRILARCIELLPPKDPEARKRIFLDKLLGDGIVLSPDAEAYIDENMSNLAGYTGRNLKEFALAVQFQAMTEGPDALMIITRAHLEAAAQIIQGTKLRIKHGQEDVTDEERRHREALAQQDQHFVQQQKITRATVSTQKTKYSYDLVGQLQSTTTISRQALSQSELDHHKAILTPAQLDILSTINDRVRSHFEVEGASAAAAAASKKEAGGCAVM